MDTWLQNQNLFVSLQQASKKSTEIVSPYKVNIANMLLKSHIEHSCMATWHM